MLEIQSLTKIFNADPTRTPATPAAPVVDHVDLQIRPGEFFSLLGPSGCGKTTLLRMIAGFETPTSGEIRHRALRVDGLEPDLRPFNLVFQRYALFPHLSVAKNLAFGLELRKLPPAEIQAQTRAMLSLVKLEGFEDRGIQTLSGGQQQRVALARALMNRPQVLLLDEPLSALDLKLRQEMRVELLEIQRRLKTTFVFVTHDQDEALGLSDRIAVMNQGRIEQVGTPREIYDHPKTPFVAKFIGSINAAKVVRPEGEVEILVRPERISIHSEGERKSGGSKNALTGTITSTITGTLIECLFQGKSVDYVIDTVHGRWQVNRPAQDESAMSLKTGERVHLTWKEQDAFVFSVP